LAALALGVAALDQVFVIQAPMLRLNPDYRKLQQISTSIKTELVSVSQMRSGQEDRKVVQAIFEGVLRIQ